ncbi:MAG TPA: hypothetical protein V6C65_36325 [Allocoleopsis sp.]
MLTRELDQETNQLLVELSQQANVPSDELLKTLIRDRWQSLQPTGFDYTQLDHIRTISSARSALPKPRNSKQAIAEFMRRKRFY